MWGPTSKTTQLRYCGFKKQRSSRWVFRCIRVDDAASRVEGGNTFRGLSVVFLGWCLFRSLLPRRFGEVRWPFYFRCDQILLSWWLMLYSCAMLLTALPQLNIKVRIRGYSLITAACTCYSWRQCCYFLCPLKWYSQATCSEPTNSMRGRLVGLVIYAIT